MFLVIVWGNAKYSRVKVKAFVMESYKENKLWLFLYLLPILLLLNGIYWACNVMMIYIVFIIYL